MNKELLEILEKKKVLRSKLDAAKNIAELPALEKRMLSFFVFFYLN